jgi:hypothetical protein
MDRLTEIISLSEPRELRDAPVQMRSLPNKERRVQTVVAAAARRPVHARELVEAILTQLRVAGIFDAERGLRPGYGARRAARAAQDRLAARGRRVPFSSRRRRRGHGGRSASHLARTFIACRCHGGE